MPHAIPHTREALVGFSPRHDAFVGVDSDGCVFDTMEIKQKQCFHGLIVSHWGLEAIEPALREAAEFVNLYSIWRGQNRFIALAKMFELLATHPDVVRGGQRLPALAGLHRLVKAGVNLTEARLLQEATTTGDADLHALHAWSLDVNAAVTRTVSHVPPFVWARRSLEHLRQHAEVLCVSQTPTDALVREWTSNDIAHLIDGIAGQEIGTKSEHLALATGGRYASHRVLMIGDAPGDHKAALANHALFYPINPAHEEASWARFFHEACARFLNGTYAGEYQDARLAEFQALLPSQPPWIK